MDNIPSKSISKSLLIATPLFLIILAVLNASNQVSYLFVLDFVNNIGGKADIIFLPTLTPQIHSKDPYKDLVLKDNEIEQPKNINSFFQSAKIPLVNMNNIKTWQQKNELVKGTSPRWLFPVISNKNIDSLIMVMNISEQQKIGFTSQSNLQNLKPNQIGIPKQLFNRLNINIGDSITINFAIKNLFNGMKLIQKFQDPTSFDQYQTDSKQIQIDKLSKQLYKKIQEYVPLQKNITEKQFQQIIRQIYDGQLNKQFVVKYVYKQSGLYPNALHNVILMEYAGFSQFLVEFIKNIIINNDKLDLKQYVPNQYKYLWDLVLNSETYDSRMTQYLTQTLQQYCIMAVTLFYSRQIIYHPDKPLNKQFTKTLQKSPQNTEVVAIYTFYRQSLSIKYFFGSVIQIFQVVTCVIYFYTMSLIMKQIYEQKQIQVGIWRTLGAGGVKQKTINSSQNRGMRVFQQSFDRSRLTNYKLNETLTFKQKVFYYYKILVKIGFLYYWLISSLISIAIYVLLKYILIGFICQLLDFNHLSQKMSSAVVLFFGVFLLAQILSINHIFNIYTAPLSLTIKPIKRTFDEVKIRIIHLATFGVSSQTLLIAIMLIYYGVVSYYWIPFSILDNDGDLQVTLFNSIFIFMIFGAIILLSVLQSSLQRLILRGLFLLNQRLRKMKVIMLKNIKAKQYKNLKMSIIIAVTFAFLLFFSTGINTQIMIVESFIQRDLGAPLVIQNYEKKSFDQKAVQSYLNNLPGVKYSWISSDINSNGISMDFVNQMDPQRKVKCQFKVMTPNYLDSSFYEYYYPQDYMDERLSQYRVLPNGIYNGFDSLYKYDKKFNNESIGKYNANETMTDFDQHHINVGQRKIYIEDYNKMAPQQQVINFAASSLLKLQLGAKVGDLYKLKISSDSSSSIYNIRSRIVHSYKIGPGMDLLRPQAFITQQQAKYIQKMLGHNSTIRYEKLLITGPEDQLKQIGNKIIAMSPEHTEMYEMAIVSQSFSLLQKYLNSYVALISAIMGTLAVLFVFLYTLGKCKDEAQMYKMLRAVGLPVLDIRIMIFLQILIRLIVSITNGILLGIVFSIGFAKQIQQFLMINTPPMDLTMILTIAIIMLVVFCITVFMASKYLTNKTVSATAKG